MTTISSNIIAEYIIPIRQGNWVVATATISADGDVVVGVDIHGDDYITPSATSVEITRKFWTQEYNRLGWSRGWDETVMTAVATHLHLKSQQPHEAEDDWLDMAHEDKYTMM